MWISSASLMGLIMAGSAVPASPSSDIDPVQARGAVHDLAQCAVTRSHRRAQRLVLSAAEGLPDVQKEIGRLPVECIQIAFNNRYLFGMPGDVIRYAFADALVAQDLPPVSPASLSAVPQLAHISPCPVSGASATSACAVQSYYAFMSRLGECVVRAAPQPARTLLGTGIGDSAELRAFEQLRPNVAGCVRGAPKVTFSRLNLRGAIAMAYYRMADAAGETAKS